MYTVVNVALSSSFKSKPLNLLTTGVIPGAEYIRQTGARSSAQESKRESFKWDSKR